MARIDFDPINDGFGFGNAWALLDASDSARLSAMLQAAEDDVDKYMGPVAKVFPVREWLAGFANHIMADVTDPVFGLCGGMAFAALDYRLAATPTSERTINRPLSPELRHYLFDRMVDSLCPKNLGRVLAWMFVLHALPFDTGQRWLRDWTYAEWKKLTKKIDALGAWPIALIGETRNPWDNHQVLAYDYTPGDTQGAVFVYDMNAWGAGHRIGLDMQGSVLAAEEEEACKSVKRGALRGLFCEDYKAVQPSM